MLLDVMAIAQAPKPRFVMWHSMSCVCKRCLENDLLATQGSPLPFSLQLLPSDT